ncbi:hypothetical protein ACFQGT_03285 [Natrialbaceae archaeon GCM10025810]|uniref:hypothetical protein n=1 Tax=Halovalidus salilacus TaxID=3075124 RepID=UPI0036151A7A
MDWIRSIDRRTALKRLGSLCGGVVVTSTAVAAGSGESAEPARSNDPDEGGSDGGSGPRPTAYPAAVDRIVDGEHVVILLEDDGRVVDERVVPSDDYPWLEEGDRVIVVLDDGELRFVAPDPR